MVVAATSLCFLFLLVVYCNRQTSKPVVIFVADVLNSFSSVICDISVCVLIVELPVEECK